jgi:hypothetical protein
LATVEDRARILEHTVELEDTSAVRQALRESRRDTTVAQRALDLRRKGAVGDDEFRQIQRLHRTISRIAQATALLDKRFQRLLSRDLLARDLVTLGDVLTWAQGATVSEMAGALIPHLRIPFRALWSTPEEEILDSGVELAGRTLEPRGGHAPKPVPVPRLSIDAQLDEALEEVHFLAAVQPDLAGGSDPVYLTLDKHGHLETGLKGGAAAVTAGQLSRSNYREAPHG